MDRLTRLLGGPTLYVKRDDCTGLATGGNKTRKLEFLIADALRASADTVITLGAVQSNHARQTAAAAAKLGLGCEILLERRVEGTDADYEQTGNVFLDRLFGANLRYLPGGTDMDAAAEALAEELRRAGRTPYIIPGGGSNPVGALGYVKCALELLTQANRTGLRIDYVVHATGSTGTQAGLVAGLEGCNTGIRVLGISVRRPQPDQEEAVHHLAAATADHLGVKTPISRDAVVVDADYVGPGYGMPTPEMVEAVGLTARHEGLLLDPVYSGKAMAGLIGLIGQGFFTSGQNVVFLHTGGATALFAYREAFAGE
jgi:L-cysteate sulfo-lyase